MSKPLLARDRRSASVQESGGLLRPAFAAILILACVATSFAAQIALGQKPGDSSSQNTSAPSDLTIQVNLASLSSTEVSAISPAVPQPPDNAFIPPQINVVPIPKPAPKTIIGKGPLSVLGIKWGSSPDDAKAAISKLPGFTLLKNDAAPDDIEYLGGKFAGVELESLKLHFSNGHFSRAVMTFKYPFAAGLPVALGAAVIKKYGPSTTNRQTRQDHTKTWDFADDANARSSTQIEYYRNWGEAEILRLTYTDQLLFNAEIPKDVPAILPSDL